MSAVCSGASFGDHALLQRKKPLTRKTALRAKTPMRAKKPLRAHAAAGAADATDAAARRLWALLADRPGPPFSQYARLGPYVADFYCPAAGLVILLESQDDPARHDWLAAHGYRVLDFAATDVTAEAVCDALAEAFALRIIKS
jgi:very-short-patch-repair endonuclease